MKYIDADKLIAEIERLCKEHTGKYECDEAALVLENLEDFIDTLEVKEVDLDNHTIMEEIRKCGCNPSEFDIAKHFFELGFNTQK